MTEQFTPTTEEVLGMLGSYLNEYGAECDMNLPGNSPDEIVDRWLAEVERAAAERAWEACLDETAKQGTIQEPDNPYRRESGQSRFCS